MSVQLKIKSKSLAAEARIIKIEEQKLLNQSRFGKLHHIKKSIRKNAASLKGLDPRSEQWRQEYARLVDMATKRLSKVEQTLGNNWAAVLEARRNKAAAGFFSVRNHRLEVVRPEARATHLTRMILKGIPYERVENSTETPLLKDVGMVQRIVTMVNKYAHTSETGSHLGSFMADDLKLWVEHSSAEELLRQIA